MVVITFLCSHLGGSFKRGKHANLCHGSPYAEAEAGTNDSPGHGSGYGMVTVLVAITQLPQSHRIVMQMCQTPYGRRDL